ncbi:hypothetical protein [uncultured Candidatus Kuenenia sp.]|uniref:hypothetical protein n=1 Tax=uncultured Candidatus Kuenenia sp. TaxID=1048336 RepID=UPI000316635E|nr:hypothetical protein [uncultured Candidatus Kuenenia sp.]
MEIIKDYQNRNIRFTGDRKDHIEQDHPEMLNQYDKIKDSLKSPFMIVRSKTDNEVELFYKKYSRTPVTEKYLCVVIKSWIDDSFIITAYFTYTIKKGEILWEEK